MAVLLTLMLSLMLTACAARTPAQNPNPNHTHADFAVWIDGKKLSFDGEEFMSGTSDASDTDHEKHDKYLHLHDGNGSVIHRHKPELSLSDFFATIKVGFSATCYSSGVPGSQREVCSKNPFRLFVNGKEYFFNDLRYVFADTDQILITNALDADQLRREMKKMTDDACKYSKTCPWKGKPPTENCIADPNVPCTQ